MNDEQTSVEELVATAHEFARHAPNYQDVKTTFAGLELASNALWNASQEVEGAASFIPAVTIALRTAISRGGVSHIDGMRRP